MKALDVGTVLFDTHGMGRIEVREKLEEMGLEVTDHVTSYVPFESNFSPFVALIESMVKLNTRSEGHTGYLNKMLVCVGFDLGFGEGHDVHYVLMSCYDGYRLDVWRVGR